MQSGLFLGVLLASTLVGSTALAERNDSDSQGLRGRAMKEQVLEKQRESFSRVSRVESHTNAKTERNVRDPRSGKGDVYGDQAQRSHGASRATTSSGRNLSATNTVNTPREVKAMTGRIHPMKGAYRVSQASEGAESYGGTSSVPNGRSGQSGLAGKNLSATGTINTPREIRAMLSMVAPMKGSYRISQAAEGAESYGGGGPGSVSRGPSMSRAIMQGNVQADSAERSTKAREQIVRTIREKMSYSSSKQE